MSDMPVNQAAPPPTAGPLRARTKTLRWSIIERRSSRAVDINISYLLLLLFYSFYVYMYG